MFNSLSKKQPSFFTRYELEIKLSVFIMVWFLMVFIFLLIADKSIMEAL